MVYVCRIVAFVECVVAVLLAFVNNFVKDIDNKTQNYRYNFYVNAAENGLQNF